MNASTTGSLGLIPSSGGNGDPLEGVVDSPGGQAVAVQAVVVRGRSGRAGGAGSVGDLLAGGGSQLGAEAGEHGFHGEQRRAGQLGVRQVEEGLGGGGEDAQSPGHRLGPHLGPVPAELVQVDPPVAQPHGNLGQAAPGGQRGGHVPVRPYDGGVGEDPQQDVQVPQVER